MNSERNGIVVKEYVAKPIKAQAHDWFRRFAPLVISCVAVVASLTTLAVVCVDVAQKGKTADNLRQQFVKIDANKEFFVDISSMKKVDPNITNLIYAGPMVTRVLRETNQEADFRENDIIIAMDGWAPKTSEHIFKLANDNLRDINHDVTVFRNGKCVSLRVHTDAFFGMAITMGPVAYMPPAND